MPTIMIDARYLNGQASGIGRYTRHLIEELLFLDPTLSLRLITDRAEPEPFQHPRVSAETFPGAANSLRTRFGLARSIDFQGVDLFHSPFNILPANLPVPAIFTLHDIMWLLNRSYCTDKLWKKVITGSFYNAFIPRSVKEARGVLTVSNHSKGEIQSYFGPETPPVGITYNGIDPFFHPQRPQDAWPLLSPYLAPRTPFVLVVGQGTPYKNHEGALRAFLDAFGEDPQVRLVFVRRLHSKPQGELKRLLEDPRGGSRILQLDYVSGEELRALYSMAQAFLFPSFYEGFGLPALEAMACGTAVITSNQGAPAEVCASGALQVNPEDTAEIAAALRLLVYDEEQRRHWEDKGRHRATEFTWRDCARQALDFYYQILEA